MPKKHTVIIIPGLGDSTTWPLEWAAKHWRLFGLQPVVHSVGWHDGEAFTPKLHRLVAAIDAYSKAGDTVSLVGTSAGGSAALNAFVERRNTVHKVINVCGRLHVGPTTGHRSFQAKSKSSPAFAESIRRCERGLKRLADGDKQRLMTVHARFGDELVPPETTMVDAAYNTAVPTSEHMLSISASLTIFSYRLIRFLKQGSY